MKLEKQRRLSQLNKEIKQAQQQLAEAFDTLHRLHHDRGELLYGPERQREVQGVGCRMMK